MLNPRGDTGQELDAKFTLEKLPDGFALTVESRGGSDHGPNPSRNKNYIDGMLLHLKRMAEHDMRLDEIQVASAKALRLPESERVVWPEGYDTRRCHAAIVERGADAMIPIRCNGRAWKKACPAAIARNDILRAQRHLGRALRKLSETTPNK